MELKKNKNECKKCGHECHCLDDFHSDVYGLCSCDPCECSDPKIKGRNVCHVNSGTVQEKLCIDPRDSINFIWNFYGR